jgi:hypothetical protein
MTTTEGAGVTVLRVQGEKGFIDASLDDMAFAETLIGDAALVDIGDEANTERPLIALVRFAPGTEIPPHYHDSDYCSIVVDGQVEVTRKVHGPGSIRIVKAGTAYGPVIAGPEGATAIEIFADRTGVAATYLGGDEAWRARLDAAAAEVQAVVE